MSLWQIAQAEVRIRTSPASGSASSTVSTVKGAPKTRQTAALVFMGHIPAGRRNLTKRLSLAPVLKVQAPSRGERE
jgi:hypothetical protein